MDKTIQPPPNPTSEGTYRVDTFILNCALFPENRIFHLSKAEPPCDNHRSVTVWPQRGATTSLRWMVRHEMCVRSMNKLFALHSLLVAPPPTNLMAELHLQQEGGLNVWEWQAALLGRKVRCLFVRGRKTTKLFGLTVGRTVGSHSTCCSNTSEIYLDRDSLVINGPSPMSWSALRLQGCFQWDKEFGFMELFSYRSYICFAVYIF